MCPPSLPEGDVHDELMNLALRFHEVQGVVKVSLHHYCTGFAHNSPPGSPNTRPREGAPETPHPYRRELPGMARAERPRRCRLPLPFGRDFLYTPAHARSFRSGEAPAARCIERGAAGRLDSRHRHRVGCRVQPDLVDSLALIHVGTRWGCSAGREGAAAAWQCGSSGRRRCARRACGRVHGRDRHGRESARRIRRDCGSTREPCRRTRQSPRRGAAGRRSPAGSRRGRAARRGRTARCGGKTSR